MLLDFRVRNYKSIDEEQTLSMVGTSLKGPHAAIHADYPGGGAGVLPCAVIYGANASGKSNLLEALVRMSGLVELSHYDSRHAKTLKANPFRLGEKSTSEPTLLEVSFLSSGTRYDYGFEYTEDKICSEWLYNFPEGRRRKLFERQELSVSFGGALKGEKKLLQSLLKERTLFVSLSEMVEQEDLAKVVEFFQNIFASNHIFVQAASLGRHFSEREIDKRAILFLEKLGTGVCDYKFEVSDLTLEQRKLGTELMRLIASYREEELSEEDLEFDKEQYEVKLGHRALGEDLVYFGVDAESAGTRRLLLLMGRIFQVLDRGGIAVIDEIDASLHTFAVEAIIRLFADGDVNKHGAQLIATTHDTNLLNPDFLRRDEIWFVEKSPGGQSEYFSLAEIKRRKSEVFERSYLQGRYGAVPSTFSAKEFQIV
ncbi:ATP/GTP-binding protein [Citreimonas sp.]|uniref:AAA family ATPase n=1 Tax=Citreimonas sp. TaxID=3036715 RepID=UPI0035C80E38